MKVMQMNNLNDPNMLLVNFPVPPDAVMPEPLQTIMFWLTATLAAVVFGYSLLLAKRLASVLPILLILGAGAAIVLEPIVAFLGHVIHPATGSIEMFTAVNRTIPWHMGFAYIAAFGTVYLVIFTRMIEGPVHKNYVWITYIVSVCAYILIEIYPVQAGLWVYYDDQPLWLWRGMAPLTWAFLNSASELLGVTLVYLLMPLLVGWRQVLVVVLCPMGALMAHLGSGWPMYSIMNSAASSSDVLLQASGLLSVGLAILTVCMCTLILSRPQHADGQ